MSNGAGIGAAMQDSARGMPAGSVAAAVVACTTVAAVLGLVGLGRESVWLDEAITARVGEMPASQFLQTITGREANSAFFSLLVRPWLAAAGNGPEALRAPSVVAFVAAVPAFYLLATKLFDRRVGLVAAALLSVNPFALYYAQTARAYSLLLLLSIVSAFLYLRMLDITSWRRVLAWVGVSVLAGWTHFFALLGMGSVVGAPAGRLHRRSRPAGGDRERIDRVTRRAAHLGGYRGGQGGLSFLDKPTISEFPN